MADIKTRDVVKGSIKTIDKAAVAGERMKQAYISTKDRAEHSTYAAENSADEYASDKYERGVDATVHEGIHQFDKAGRKGLETTKDNIHKRQADKVVYTSKEYTRGCMHKRNRHLVDNSSICIAYLTEQSGGTAYTVDYARKNGLIVINIAEKI